jgi:hypothetical protein
MKMQKFALLLMPFLAFSQNKNCVTLVHQGYTSVYDTVSDYPVMVSWIDTKDMMCDDVSYVFHFLTSILYILYANMIKIG